MRRRLPSHQFLLVLSLAVAACSPEMKTFTEPPTQGEDGLSLLVISGDQQTAYPGQELPAPIVVKAVDKRGRAVAGQIVNFKVTLGGGAVFAGAALTDSRGIAQERWTVGEIGPQRVEARAVDPKTGVAVVFGIFTATAISRWALIAPEGAGPTGFLNASAHAPALQAIFAGSMPDNAVGSLWRFDLSTNSWTPLPAANWPIGKYRKLIHDPANHRLLTYWDGLGQVYSIPENGGSWAPVGSAPNSEAYYEGFAFLNPVSGRLTQFAGYGQGSWKNEWWEWDDGAGAWTSAPQAGTLPEPRFGYWPSGVAIDPALGRAFLGHRGLGATPGGYDDLWMVDLTTRTWTNLVPPDNGPDAMINSGLAFDPGTSSLYRFGGLGFDLTTVSNQLRTAKPYAAPVTWSQMPESGSGPSPRAFSGVYVDQPRHRLIVMAGSTPTETRLDVWGYALP